MQYYELCDKTRKLRQRTACMLMQCNKSVQFLPIFDCCVFDIPQTDIFQLVFYSEWKNWLVIDNNLSRTIGLVCFCAMFSNIYCKINFTTKNGSCLCNFYNKLDFWKIFSRKYLLLFFTGFKLLMFHNNIVKISEILNKWNLLKTCIQITYLVDFFHNLQPFLLQEKWNFSIFLKTTEQNNIFGI